MKVIVNLPEKEADKEELENRVADFHAALMIEKIKQLNINDKSKKEVLNLILQDLKREMHDN